MKANRRAAAGSPSRGHKRPGESSSSSAGEADSHWGARVTPGLSCTRMTARPARKLIRVLLPTLGTPSTIARAARGRPLAAARSTLPALSASTAFRIACFRLPISTAIARAPSAVK